MKKLTQYKRFIILIFLIVGNVYFLEGQECFDSIAFEKAVIPIDYLTEDVMPCLGDNKYNNNLSDWTSTINAYRKMKSPKAASECKDLLIMYINQTQTIAENIVDKNNDFHQKKLDKSDADDEYQTALSELDALKKKVDSLDNIFHEKEGEVKNAKQELQSALDEHDSLNKPLSESEKKNLESEISKLKMLLVDIKNF